MHSLASLFVSLVVVANAVFPKSDIPRVLGVQIAVAGNEETTTQTSNTTNEASKEIKARDFYEKSREILKLSRNRLKNTLELNNLGKEDDGTESAKKRLEEMKLRREEFKEKINEISDEKKKERLNQIDSKLTKVNQKAVEHWSKILDRLTQILGKIKTKTDEAAVSGKDVTEILAAITIAEIKIDDAKSAVNTQSANTYVIEIGEEGALGESAKETITEMRVDLKEVEAKVKDAVESVKEVYKSLKAVVGVETATPKP